MSVPSLKNIAFNNVLLNLWKDSELPTLIAKFAVKKKCKKLFNESFINKNFDLIELELEKVSDDFAKITHVPWIIKTKLLVALNGLNDSIKDFAIMSAVGLQRNTIKNGKFCISNVILSQNGDIDGAKTILNVMKKSKFNVMYKSQFPGQLGVDQSKVLEIFHHFKERVTKTGKINGSEAKKLQNIERDIFLMMDPLTFWNTFINTQKLSRAEALRSMTHMEFAAWIGNVEALKLFFELKLEKLRPQALEKAAKYALLKFSLYEHTIVFFYENLEPCTWNNLLHDNFQAIFHCLLSSWNYRHLCLKFFKDVKASLDVKTYRSLLSRIGFTWYQSRFEYYDVIQIIQSIWLDTPDDFKEDHDVSFVIIPEIILIKCDFQVLPHFIATYNQEKQKEIIGLILFGLITSSNERLIRHVFEYVEPLGFYFVDCKDFLTKKLLKKFLLMEARKSYSKSYENLEKVREFIRICDAGEAVSYEDLFNDRDFIVELFVQMSQKKDMDLFLKWGLKNESEIEDFVQKLIKDGLVNDIYDQRLLENENVETAYDIFEMLVLTGKQIVAIEQSVSDNPQVITYFLINLLETDKISCTKEHMTRFFPNYEKQKAFMENFLLNDSGYGLRAIYEMFLRMANLLENKSPELREPWDLFDYLATIRNNWLTQYELVSRFETVLQEKGHPNLNPFKIRIKDQLPEPKQQSRAVVNALYRGFRAMLQKKFGGIYFVRNANLSLFSLSAMMIDEVNINVPSVL